MAAVTDLSLVFAYDEARYAKKNFVHKLIKRLMK